MSEPRTIRRYQPETVKIADLTPHPRNYRTHPVDQLAHLKASLVEHGQYRNVVVARDGTILAGHGVVEAAAEAGEDEVQAIRLDLDPHEPRALKLLAGDNEAGRLADIDDRILSEILKEVRDLDDLLGTGYDDQTLASLVYVTRPMSEIESMDEASQWVGLPGFEAASADEIVLVLRFDDEDGREKVIEQLALTISKKTRQTWSAYWPPREKQDLASLRFDG